MKCSQQTFDVVVVGAGGAGMRAALQLAESNYKVAVLSKVFPTRSHTVSAQGGVAAALGNQEEDRWQWHLFDTVMGGDFLGDQHAIEYMCQQAIPTVYELEHMGVPFSRLENGRIYQRYFGGHTMDCGKKSVHRACAAADRTGHAILHTLYQKNLQANTHFLSEWYAIDLVKGAGNEVVGVVAICMETGETVFFRARAVILATGGAGRIYQSTTNAYINTGDGLGMALRAGFPLQDMEFWQFHPTGVYGAGVLLSEGCRGEGGYLVNKNGERFMERYQPVLKDLACRDIVSRCSMMEILAGRGVGPKGDHVLLRIDHLSPDVLEKRLPGIVELTKKFAGVDPSKEPIPVVPTCHYMMGGIPTNIHAQALTVDNQGRDQIIPGLYAAGECASVSVHGANRLGANSLLDIVVFGRAAGLSLQENLKQGIEMAPVDEGHVEAALNRVAQWENNHTQQEDPYVLRHEMRQVMQDHFGVFRDQTNMDAGRLQLDILHERLKNARLADRSRAFNMARFEALELDNLMAVARATAVSAAARTESRGAHSRNDFIERDDKNWLKHSLYFADGRMAYRAVNRQPQTVNPIELQERE